MIILITTLKKKLIDFFNDRLVVHNVSGNKSVLCMSQTSHKNLDFWYSNRELSTEEERKRIERTVARMKTLKKMKYDCGRYRSGRN